MEGSEHNERPEARPSGGPIAELVDDEDMQGGYLGEPLREVEDVVDSILATGLAVVEHVHTESVPSTFAPNVMAEQQEAINAAVEGVDFIKAISVVDPNAPLVDTTYVDEEGRHWKVKVPLGSSAPASMGIPVGPPDVSVLDLPFDVSVRLHNQLFNRGLFTKRDLRARGQEVFAALQAAYRVDVQAVTALYR